MGFGSWMKNLLGGGGDEKKAPEVEITHGLNFQSVISVHMGWRKRLSDVIKGVSKEKLSVAQVGASDQCALGKWLNGSVKDEYANSPDFQALVAEHARFHQAAGQILQLAQAGKKQDAEKLLLTGDFPKLSTSLVMRLGNLYRGFTGHAIQEPAAEEDDDSGADDEVAGLNFRSVVDAHLAWRSRLADVINGKSNEKLEVAKVGADDQCALGKWIKGPIKDQFVGDSAFQTLVTDHARFHEIAGQVLQQAQGGQTAQAQQLLNDREFVGLSRKLCTQLLNLHQTLSKKA